MILAFNHGRARDFHVIYGLSTAKFSSALTTLHSWPFRKALTGYNITTLIINVSLLCVKKHVENLSVNVEARSTRNWCGFRGGTSKMMSVMGGCLAYLDARRRGSVWQAAGIWASQAAAAEWAETRAQVPLPRGSAAATPALYLYTHRPPTLTHTVLPLRLSVTGNSPSIW